MAVVTRIGEATVTEKRTRFHATLMPTASLEDAKKAVEARKRQYRKARHTCWACRVRDTSGNIGQDVEFGVTVPRRLVQFDGNASECHRRPGLRVRNLHGLLIDSPGLDATHVFPPAAQAARQLGVLTNQKLRLT